MKGKDLPPPDVSGTDPDATLSQRFSMGGLPAAAPPAGPPGPFEPTGLPGQPSPGHLARQRTQRKSTRPDPEGMRRASYYITREAADALDEAAAVVMSALGGVPKHVALSALILAAAERATEVATSLGEARTAALADRLQALREETGQARDDG